MDVIVGGIVGGSFSDPTNERLILLSAVGLVLVGVGLLVGTIVWWRRGREENPVLAPLELMSSRAWVKSSDAERRRRLDEVRVAGAGGASDVVKPAEPVDLEELMRSDPQAFDDLREPGIVVDVPNEADELVEGWQVAAEGEQSAELVDAAEPLVADEAVEVVEVPDADSVAVAAVVAEGAATSKATTRSGSRSKAKAASAPAADGEVAVDGAEVAAVAVSAATPKSSTRSRSRTKPAAPPAEAGDGTVEQSVEVAVAAESAAAPKRATRSRTTTKAAATEAPAAVEIADPDATQFSAQRPYDEELAADIECQDGVGAKRRQAAEIDGTDLQQRRGGEQIALGRPSVVVIRHRSAVTGDVRATLCTRG